MSRSPSRIALVTLGDPRNPKAFSGWTYAIIQGFEGMGVEVMGIDTDVLGIASKFLYYSLHQMRRFRPTVFLRRKHLLEELQVIMDYPRADFQRMRMPQSQRARYALNQVKALGIRKVLHYIQNSIPVDRQPDRDIEQYLLLDSTWHIESANLYFRNRFTPEIIRSFQTSEEDAFTHIRHFFAVSEYVADDLMNYYGVQRDRISIVGSGWGPIEPFFGDKDYAHGPILFVAKMRFEDKGGRLLIEAFRIARQRLPQLRLVIAGQNSYPGSIGNVPGLRLCGHISREELQRLFQESALFAMPAYSEPWGMVYLEALISKTPILGLRRTALPEFTGNGRFGFMVDRSEPEAIADELIDAMSDPARLRRMGEAGQQFVLNRYGWKTMVERLCEGMGVLPVHDLGA